MTSKLDLSYVWGGVALVGVTLQMQQLKLLLIWSGKWDDIDSEMS